MGNNGNMPGKGTRFTIAEVAKICGRSQNSIRRWVAEGMFSEHIKVKDGYLFHGSCTVKCFRKNGDTPMTLIEIAEINEVSV